MNCLCITLFFNIVAGIVQTFIKSWNQLLYPRVIEVCRLPLEPRRDFFWHHINFVEIQECGENPMFHLKSQWSQKLISFPYVAREKLQRGSCVEKSYDGTHLAFGGTLDRRCHFKHVTLKQSLY